MRIRRLKKTVIFECDELPDEIEVVFHKSRLKSLQGGVYTQYVKHVVFTKEREYVNEHKQSKTNCTKKKDKN